MRIGVHTWGSEGDIRPAMALARGLSAHGHTVTVAYTAVDGRSYDDLAAGTGIVTRQVGADYFRSLEGITLSQLKGDPLVQLKTLVSLLLDPVVDEMYRASAAVCTDTDLDIIHFLHHPAISASEKKGNRTVALFTVPVLPSRHYTPAGVGAPAILNRLLWAIADPFVNRLLVSRVNDLRRREGLPPARRFYGDWLARFPLTLTAVSPVLFPHPSDWEEHHKICGFLKVADTIGHELPPPLTAFLDAGDPPALFTFGSMLAFENDDARRSVDLLVAAARLSGRRVIVQAPGSLLERIPSDATLFPLARASHEILFPRCAAIVHHGGAGTTQTAVRAGRPSVVVPHLMDQFFWGDLLYRRGMAPPPIRRHRLTAEKLAHAIQQAATDPATGERAAAIGTQVAAEDGITRAVELIERHIDTGGGR